MRRWLALSRLLGFDLCPRLKALSDRRLFLPRGSEVPESVRVIVLTRTDPKRIAAHPSPAELHGDPTSPRAVSDDGDISRDSRNTLCVYNSYTLS